MKFKPTLFFSAMLCAWLLGISTLASAGRPSNITDAEMALIPKYCPDTMGFGYGDAYSNTSPRAAGWVALMGKGFWAVHHYCWGLISQSRATRRGVPAVIRKGTLEGVRNEYLYVINNTPSDFILLPEIYTRLGEVELLLTNPSSANDAFARARQLKPDYWPAYTRWAEVLIRVGKHTEAKELIKSGLEYSPTAKVLIEQYRLLGGNPSEIVPKSILAHPPTETEETNTDSSQNPVGGGAELDTPISKPHDSPK